MDTVIDNVDMDTVIDKITSDQFMLTGMKVLIKLRFMLTI